MNDPTLYTDVNAWLLSDQVNYAAGLALLRRSGMATTSLTYTVLSRGADAYTRKKLATTLTDALASAAPIPVAPLPTPTPVVASPDQARLAPLYDERTEAKAKLRAWLDDDTKADARRVLALRIKAITAQIDDHFHPAPPLPATAPMSLLNVRSSVSRYRKKVADATTEAVRQAAQAKLQEYETLLAQLTHATI